MIVDVEATPARTYDEVESTKTMLDRTECRLNLKPKRLAADTAYGTGRFLGWLVCRGIAPHIPVRDAGDRGDRARRRRVGHNIDPGAAVVDIVASAMTAVASHPTAAIKGGSVSRPMMRGFIAITIMTAISGAASTPLTTALQ